jgi:pyridoxine 4-dehydrogenase
VWVAAVGPIISAEALVIGGRGVVKKQVKVGRTKAGPIDVSSLGCGTWSWGNKLLWDYDPSQDEEIYEAYRAVRLAGVSLFDTADSYGTLDLNGRAEILLGQFEKRLQTELSSSTTTSTGTATPSMPVWSFLFPSTTAPTQMSMPPPQQVATKFAPYPWRITRGSMVAAARASLKRLDQDKLTLAQLHWSTANYQPFQEGALWQGIADVYDEGLCEAVGVSNYGPKQLVKFADCMAERQVPLATAQVQYSLMTYKDTGLASKEACDDAGCTLISYSPLCLGLLTGKYNLDNLPRSGNPRRQLFKELLPGAQPLLNTLAAIAKDVDKTQSQVAINWAMCKGTVPIPGARNLKQAQENLGAVGWSLSNGAVDELDRAANDIGKSMIQNIFQTQ